MINGQGQKINFEKEVYSKALNCYVDSILKSYEFDRSEFPEKFRYLKFMVVADSSISNYCLDTTKFIIWKKVEPHNFFKVKRLNRFGKIIFLKPAEITDEIIRIPVLIYYSHNKDSIFYSSVYHVYFKYSCAKRDFLLDKIEYQGGIIR